MPFARPDLATLVQRIQADITSRFPELNITEKRSVINILSRMEAGVAHGLYGYLDWLALQLMPDTAQTEHLERWASIWGIYRKQATFAEGEIEVTGLENSIIPQHTLFISQNGKQYFTIEEISLPSSGKVHIALKAKETGTLYNISPCTLSLASPISGIQAQAKANFGFGGGTDEEKDSSLRTRLLYHIQRTPMGGRAYDYEEWALEVAGITRAFVTQEMGKGTVTLRFMMDDTYENGIPKEQDRQKLVDYIETKRPVTAQVFVVLPVPKVLNIQLQISPDTPSLRREVVSQLQATLRRDAIPSGTIFLSRLHEAISLAKGEEDHIIFNPVANVIPQTGEIVVLGNVEFIHELS